MKWTPDIVIPGIVIVGCILLIALGIDSEVKSILTIAAGWAFGSQFQTNRLTSSKITAITTSLRDAGCDEDMITRILAGIKGGAK